jgi:YHS domain-containing protein
MEVTMKVHDEACGMTIESDSAAASADFQRKTYYFCSERCRTLFVEHPDRYVPVREQAVVPASRSVKRAIPERDPSA